MKKTFALAIVLLIALFLTPCAQGFEVEKERVLVPTSESASMPSYSMEDIKKAMRAERKGIVADVEKSNKALAEKKDAATVKELQNGNQRFGLVAENLIAVNAKVDTVAGTTVSQLINYVLKSTKLLLLCLLPPILLILAALIYFGWRWKRNKPATVEDLKARDRILEGERDRKFEEFANDLTKSFAKVVETTVGEIPGKTVVKIEEFNARTILFDVKTNSGDVYAVEYDAADEGDFNTLEVESMPDGLDHPESYVVKPQDKRRLAKKYSQGMMMKYFNGELKGTAEERLIDLLHDQMKLRWTKK